MREILFKAKRTDNGEWVCWNLFSGLYGVDINKDTICQYTGLTDKNGNKIWENDILTYDAYNDGVVRYGEAVQGACSHVGFYVDWLNKDACLRSDLGFWMSKRDIEVTGNIFDEP